MTDSIFSPEAQYLIYLACRDGDINSITNFFHLNNENKINLNIKPFDSLWHEPGNESSLLHLASCCIQVELVEFLLKNGSNPLNKANGLTCLDILEKYELFEPARLKNFDGVEKIRFLLLEYSQQMIN